MREWSGWDLLTFSWEDGCQQQEKKPKISEEKKFYTQDFNKMVKILIWIQTNDQIV